MTLPAGTKLGPYELLERIGAGGMGEVYRARDTRLGREVAIKLVSDRYLAEAFGSGSGSPGTGTPVSGTPGTLSHRRFLREAQSSSALNHPNICTIYDIGEQDGRPYLVMELLRGETLKEALRRSALSVTEIVTFSRQMASALAAAHAQGIIHRDIKPANIFVVGHEGKRQIKILDFGLAKQQGAENLPESGDATATFGGQQTAMGDQTAAADLTSPGSTLGTVAYMSPEQAEGQPLDARTDLFSMGTVIFEMATGKVPFVGASPAGIFAALLREDVPAVSAVRGKEERPPMPAGFDAIEAKLLMKDRTQRYQHATEVERDLEGLGSGASAEASGSFAAASGSFAAASSGSSASVPVANLAGASSTSSGASAAYAASGANIPVAAKSTGGRRRRTEWIVGGLIIAAAMLGAAAYHRYNQKPTGVGHGDETTAQGPYGQVTEKMKDSIILANFVNQTGDPVFDTTLNQALRIDLEQSPVLSIVSQEHLRQSVRYLGKPEDTMVTPEIAREIGEREGMKAILTGTIARLGNEYLITLTAQNTATGDEIASEQVQAADKDHVVDALSKAAAAMRAKLGEDLASIKKLNTPFGQATTPSLEAFRAYALGDLAHEKGNDIPEAEGHYKRAVELDPNFAMAYARLGVVYSNSGQLAKAIPYFTKAHELSKHVSESEKFYITGHYNENVTGDVPKVIETLQESIQTYPSQLSPYVNINVAYQYIGQFDKALPYAQKAVELSPEDAIAAENLLTDLMALSRLDEVRQEIERENKLGMEVGTSVTVQHVIGYFMLGEPQEMQRLVASAAGRPDEFLTTVGLGTTQQYAGQYRESSQTFQRAFGQAGRAKAPDAQAGILLVDAAGRGLAGLCDENEAKVKQAMTLDKSKQTLELASLASAICGNSKLSLPIAEDLNKKNPQDTMVEDVYLPLSKAFAAFAAGDYQQAVAAAEPTKSYDALYPGSYVQGLAYLQLHDAGNAVKAFQAATKTPAGSLAASQSTVFNGPAQLGMARAYAMAGDKAEAKKAYEKLFVMWKNADADLPMLVAAKKEYAGL
jgi:serine/threonine protein kinase/tetratricopeptide (TPR) repeat protein